MPSHQRIHAFDIIRGAAVVSMILFHWCYDLTALRGLDIAWFSGWFEDVWRASISWTFLLLAGWMHSLSRDDLRRAGRYLAVAAAIYIVTWLVRVDVPISFGIIYCMGASTLLWWGLRRIGLNVCGWRWAIPLAIAFLFLLGLPRGTVGFGPWQVPLPPPLYSTEWLSWLGLPGPTFESGDYYPLLPFGLLYGVGVAWGYAMAGRALPRWFLRLRCRPLEFVGRHSLLIYVLHQPVLIGLLALVPA